MFIPSKLFTNSSFISALPLYTFFFFNDTATTEIYTLSLHDALPISPPPRRHTKPGCRSCPHEPFPVRSEEHTSELQSHSDLVCRLLLEKKKVIYEVNIIWTPAPTMALKV